MFCKVWVGQKHTMFTQIIVVCKDDEREEQMGSRSGDRFEQCIEVMKSKKETRWVNETTKQDHKLKWNKGNVIILCSSELSSCVDRWSIKRVLCPIGCYHQNKKKQKPEFFKVNQKRYLFFPKIRGNPVFSIVFLIFWFTLKNSGFVFFYFGGSSQLDTAPVL